MSAAIVTGSAYHSASRPRPPSLSLVPHRSISALNLLPCLFFHSPIFSLFSFLFSSFIFFYIFLSFIFLFSFFLSVVFFSSFFSRSSWLYLRFLSFPLPSSFLSRSSSFPPPRFLPSARLSGPSLPSPTEPNWPPPSRCPVGRRTSRCRVMPRCGRCIAAAGWTAALSTPPTSLPPRVGHRAAGCAAPRWAVSRHVVVCWLQATVPRCHVPASLSPRAAAAGSNP